MGSKFWLGILFLVCMSQYAEARHFTLSDSLLAENDSLITNSLFFKTHKKTGEEFIHKKSIPFLDSLATFLIKNKEVEIEIIRFHSPLVRNDYTFIGGDCKPYTQLDLAANHVANLGVQFLRIRLRECQELPIAKDFDMEKLTIIRITKAKKEKVTFKPR